MSCCDWDDFRLGLLSAWQRDKHKPSELLINWRLARKYWKRHHCTGGEAASVQIHSLRAESDYLWFLPRGGQQDDDGPRPVKPKPRHPIPCGATP